MLVAKFLSARAGLAALLLVATPSLATPPGMLREAIRDEAAIWAVSPSVAAEISRLLAEEFDRKEAIQAGADAPTDRTLFVGPHRAWIVLAEHQHLGDAERAFAAFRKAGAPVFLLELRDGGYELALRPRPVSLARRALERARKDWRRSGRATAAPRLSGGAAYLTLRYPEPRK